MYIFELQMSVKFEVNSESLFGPLVDYTGIDDNNVINDNRQ